MCSCDENARSLVGEGESICCWRCEHRGGGGECVANRLMQRVTACRGPARSGKWPESGCRCYAAAGCCVRPGPSRPEPAGSGPRRPVLAGGLHCSQTPAPAPPAGGECPARPPAAREGA